MSRSPKAISTELTGGAGFNYEAFVAAYYLSSLLRCEGAQGQEGIVTSVAVQQKNYGHPMDDLVVEFDDEDKKRVLGLQIKKSLTVGNNKTFHEIVASALETQSLTTFTKDADKCGFIAEYISVKSLRNLKNLIGWSPDSGKFEVAIDTAGEEHKKLRDKLRPIINPADIGAEANFYRHFVALNLTEDFMKSELVNRLQELVILNEYGQGHLLFDRLYQIARKGAEKGKIWTRGTLLEELRGVVKLKAIPYFEADIKRFEQHSASALDDVSDKVGGFHVERDELQSKIEEQLNKHRVVSISGLPGCGKSAVLKRFAEKAAVNKPIIFLRGDRIDEKHWNGFAIKLGLKNVDAVSLLQEIGSVGVPILFIDGIDRIRPDQRNVIIDLINFIHNDSSLSNWKVLVTSRDQGLETFRTWFPKNIYAKTGIGNVTVESFSDDEAKILADEVPQLHSLLFGDEAVKEIARRPFFTSILAHSIPEGIKPKTEIDLITAWWEQAGHDATSDPIPRRRAIIDLAEKGVRNLGRSIPARELKDATFNQITTLKTDQIISEEQGGAFYSFAHDIFFEWAFFKLLIELQDNWIGALRKAGEPPLLGRVVRLKAQATMAEKGRWSAEYHLLAGNKNLRKQWQREWLTAPPFAQEFGNFTKEFASLLKSDDFALFEKMLVWFQAQHTKPNFLFLPSKNQAANISTQTLADYFSLPSDSIAWIRLIYWIISEVDAIPVRLTPQVLDIFNVWQNVCAGFQNSVSECILECVNAWLIRFEKGEFHDGNGRVTRTSYYRGESDVGQSLRSILLRSARSYPDFAKSIFERAIADKKYLGEIYSELIGFSPIMTQVAPDLVAELAEAELLEELPKDKLAKKSSHHYGGDATYWWYEHKDFSINQNHYSVWNQLLNREPFKSLFEYRPDVALRLVRNLANHATKSWRQIHSLRKQEMGTPIPIRIEFPWGAQEFWGNERVYIWGYGGFVSSPLEVAFLALKDWAFKEIDGGRSASEVIKEIVEENTCCAILGISILLILEKKETTETTLAISTCQQLWGYDIRRWVQESSKNTDDRKSYKQNIIHDLTIPFALNKDKNIREAFKSALAQFPNNLPFEIEEQKYNERFIAETKERAEQWSGLGNVENYKSAPHGKNQTMIFYDAPKSLTHQAQKKLEGNNAFLERMGIIHLADESLKDDNLADGLRLNESVIYAKNIDNKTLFGENNQDDYLSSEATITSIAACIIRFGEPNNDDYEWAWEIMARAEAMKPQDDSLSSESLASFHPVKYLIIALQHDRSLTTPRSDSAERLLKLTVHPNYNLRELGFNALYFDKDDHLRWVACQLAANLCITHRGRPNEGGWDDSANKKAQSNSLTSALHAFKAQETTPMPKLPLAWINRNIERKQQKQWWNLQRHSNGTSDDQEWIPPNVFFNSQFAAKIFAKMPVEVWMESDVHRPLFEAFLLELVQWTIDIIIPPSQENKKQYYQARTSFDWDPILGDLLARVVPFVPFDFMRNRLLEPFFANNEDALSVLSSFAEMLVCRHIYNATDIPQNAIPLLNDCVKRVVSDKNFHHASRLPSMERLISVLLFVHIRQNASGAVRYANGDWSEIDAIMPIIDKMVRHIGWSPHVMSNFLDLCERAGKSYPVSTFAQQMNVALSDASNVSTKWNELRLLPRIAAIVQRQADWNYRLRYEDAHALLKILDALIDLGDRRSAALEQTEAFRSIQERPSLS